MSLRLSAAITVMVALFSWSAPASAADEIVLKDGTRIVGKVLTLSGGKIVVEVASASDGKLTLKFEDVVSIRTESDQKVELDNGSILNGPIVGEDGKVRIGDDVAGERQIDISSITNLNKPPKKAITHKGFIGVSGRIADGNARTKTAQGIAEYTARTESTRLTIRGDMNYGEDSGQVSQRNAQGTLKYDLFLSERLFLFASALFTGDEFASLNLRTALSGGVGYQFFDTELDETPYEFYEEFGVAYFNEDFQAPATDSAYAAGRLAGRFDWNIGGDRIILFHYHEAYFGFEDSDDINALTQQGARFNIMGNFYANIQVNVDYDNTPAPGRKRLDTEYLYGLGYTFNF